MISLFAGAAAANGIASFPDPQPNGGPEAMFIWTLNGARLYGGWSGPPGIELRSPGGTFPDCTMWLPPLRVYANGVIPGGQIALYMHNQTEVLSINFTNGHVDSHGFGCGPKTGGTVEFNWLPEGVQLPPGLTEPLAGGWFYFEFHNQNGENFGASFACGAEGRTGDMNCDGAVDFADINPFVLALSDPAGYAKAYPWCASENADANGDQVVDFADINAFVGLLGR